MVDLMFKTADIRYEPSSRREELTSAEPKSSVNQAPFMVTAGVAKYVIPEALKLIVWANKTLSASGEAVIKLEERENPSGSWVGKTDDTITVPRFPDASATVNPVGSPFLSVPANTDLLTLAFKPEDGFEDFEGKSPNVGLDGSLFKSEVELELEADWDKT